MESRRCTAEGKGLLFSDEIDLSIHSFGRSRKFLTGWDGDSVESMEFVDLGFSETPKMSFYCGDRGVEMFGSVEVGIDPSKVELTSPSFMIASTSSLESGSNHSNSFMEANSHDSSLIDLKVGRLADDKNAANSKVLKERSVGSSVKPASQVKRARTVNSRLQTSFCQVYGCHKDLSSLKDYNKRHKVCEVHSKTPRVIVNGLEQRFCQQCSRFHLLVEFDEGKRSCRKRLAGHNERRRKPQIGGLSGRPHKLLQSYQGTKFLESSFPKKASIIFPNILPGSILYSEKYEQANFSKPIKLEEKSVYCADGQLLPKSFLHIHGNEIQNTSGKFPPAAEGFSVLNEISSTHDLAAVPDSSCALSLLSAESQDLSHSTGIIMSRPFVSQANRFHHTEGFPDKSFGVESSGKYVTNAFHSAEMNSIKVNHTESFMVSYAGHAADFQADTDGYLHEHEAKFLNAKYCVSAEDGSTVDLLQLSSHLHRAEQQRNSAQVKHEIEDFSSFLPTYGT